MHLVALTILLLGLQDDWPRRKAAFFKAFKEKDTAAQRAVVRWVGSADRVEAAELLVQAWVESERRVRNADDKAPCDFDAERALRSEITLAIGSFTDATATRWLASQLRDGPSEELRETIAAAAWRLGGAPMAEQVGRCVKGDRSPIVHASAIDAARAMGLSEHLGAVVGHLSNAHWRVRRAAVRFVRAVDAEEAVRPLIGVLREEGPLRDEVNDALVALTGVNKRGDHATWLDWWETEGKSLDKRPSRADRLAALEASKRAGDTQTVIYGVPVVSRKVLFVVDVSGSMDEKSTWRPEEDPKRFLGDRKIDIARFEVKRVIDRLAKEATFNVVAFNTKLWLASDEMLAGERENKKMAFDWIDEWKSEGGTNSYGALMRALEIAGAHRQRMAADTIYFISDGKPTLGRPEWILSKVREKNPHAKVIIHAIAVGESADRPFMEALAEENGGDYYER